MLPAIERAPSRAAASRPGGWLFVNVLMYVDRWLLRATSGRLSTAAGTRFHRHIVMLTTTGARTGQPRTVPLLALFDGQSVILIASRGGHAEHPAWYHNLRGDPLATAMVLGRKTQYRAREAEGATRDRLWTQAVELYPGYADYQARVARRVPVMILEAVAPLESQHRASRSSAGCTFALWMST